MRFPYFEVEPNIAAWDDFLWITSPDELFNIPIRHVYPDEAMIFLLEYFEMEISNNTKRQKLKINSNFKVETIEKNE